MAQLAGAGRLPIAGYTVVLAVHFLAAVAGRPQLTRPLIWLGLPLSLLTAVYTAYLFAQAKARDLWQNPLLPPHLTVQALLAGAAALIPAALLGRAAAAGAAARYPGGGGPAASGPGGRRMHADARHRARASRRPGDVARPVRAWFWAGIGWSGRGAGLAVGDGGLVARVRRGPGRRRSHGRWASPPWPTSRLRRGGGRLGLAGLLAYEHAYVQAGQSVPLA